MKLITVFLLLFLSFHHSSAQTLTSPNLLTTPTGVVNYTGTGQGYSGGSTPGYNSTNNTIYFGYTQSQVAYTYAFSQALQNSGMNIIGYNYGWSYLNEGTTAGNLSAVVNFAGTSGASLYSKSWTLGTTSGWTSISGTETFANSGLLASNISNFTLTFNGKDNRFWAGYYGPQVRDASLSLNYTFDACSADPLSSPTCPGYAAALLAQQCSINPLYDSSCTGYAAAFLTQQCTANPLYSPSCSGYAAAYKTQQCTANALYATDCPGYDAAYKTQQCNLDGLYAKDCPNYNEAYAKKNILNISSTSTPTSTTTTSTSTVSTTSPSTTVSSDGTVSTTVAVVSDSNVNNAITQPSTTSATSVSPASPTSVLQPQPTQQVQTQPAQQQSSTQSQQPQQSQSSSSSQPSARQSLQERRMEQARQQAVERGKNLAKDMGSAASLEKQMELQGVVLSAMAYVPGFDVYNKTNLPDAAFYAPYQAYGNQRTVDNARASRRLFGGSDRVHQEMVDQQYNQGK